jgi:SAM-dependent methyltransferase
MIGASNQDFRTIPGLWPDLSGVWVLDLGTGNGLYSCELSRRGAFVVALDFDKALLQMARGQDADGQGLFVCADAGALPFREGVFDMALSVEVLTHIPPDARSRVFAGVARVLKAGGRAYYTLHNRLRLTLGQWARLRRSRVMYATDHLNVWPLNPAQARAAIADCGMRPETKVKYLNYHSRLSHAFCVAHPQAARVVIALEEVLTRMPVLRRLAITFLCVGQKPALCGDTVNGAED